MVRDLIRLVSLTMSGSSSILVRATVMSAGDCSDLSSVMAVSSVTIHESGLCVRSFYYIDWSRGLQMAINRDYERTQRMCGLSDEPATNEGGQCAVQVLI
jgi:hypothetical protein